MARYTPKASVIDAVQWHKAGDHPAVRNAFDEGDHWPAGTLKVDCEAAGYIGDLTGGVVVVPGDWIITNGEGVPLVCKPDVFEATYEPADE